MRSDYRYVNFFAMSGYHPHFHDTDLPNKVINTHVCVFTTVQV